MNLLLTLVDDPDVSETVPSKLQSYFGAGKPIIAAVNGEAARIVEEAGAGIGELFAAQKQVLGW